MTDRHPRASKHSRVTQVSTRDPRGDWARPRSERDVVAALHQNAFVRCITDCAPVVGVGYLRVVGKFALRVTIAEGRATLEVSGYHEGDPMRWRPYHVPAGAEPWKVVREALELLATLDVDTPIRWG